MKMVTLKMGDEVALLPGDPLGRTAMGYPTGGSLLEQECWDRTKGLWFLDERRVLAESEAYVVDKNWIVRAVAEITGVSKHGHKRAIEGVVIHGHPLVGSACPESNDSRNGVGYF